MSQTLLLLMSMGKRFPAYIENSDTTMGGYWPNEVVIRVKGVSLLCSSKWEQTLITAGSLALKVDLYFLNRVCHCAQAALNLIYSSSREVLYILISYLKILGENNMLQW